ncbi:methyltransferase domain-containing protein [Candidatus Entotheonella palauensis]|uniref:methyltransferase domain-containing protein n=1 Tax=Candidatus Entotheonella palauensis TaxID=93172 RepID=UPI000B7D97AE|nr:methyltransferase domain-containing protein [Candidatus Entotheonella palauensis]
MIDFRQRSTAPEYIDHASIGGDEVVTALSEIESVNRWLGGINATRYALNRLLPDGVQRSLSFLDLGTGSADIPIAVARWARQRGMAIDITAVDFNPDICQVARQRTAAYGEITVREADVFALSDTGTFDVVHGAMFLHHFPQSQAAALLRLMYNLCQCGIIIINDLHRHPLAYYSIIGLSRLLSFSPMFQHDGPISVLRGFQRSDLEHLQ